MHHWVYTLLKTIDINLSQKFHNYNHYLLGRSIVLKRRIDSQFISMPSHPALWLCRTSHEELTPGSE